jgi:hypothetical protein
MSDFSPANTVPIYAGTAATFNGTATINLESSIARDYQNGWTRSAAAPGTANVNISHSNINAVGFDFGTGATSRTSSIFADPLFTNVGAGDYTLLPASPSIDAGDPASLLTEDFAENLRPVDGDGDGADVVDQGALEAPADTTAPDTVIDTGPADGSTITAADATFTFHGEPQAETAKFQCKLDGGAFADCTSPKTFTGLSEGSHTVQIRAEDGAGNQDPTSATRTFTVDAEQPPPADTTAPQTTIDSGPGAKAKKGKPKFTFFSDENGSSFECSLVKKGKAAKFATCSSPQSYKLKRKKKTTKYTFSVRATDAAGNTDATPATAGFKVKKKPKKK